MGEESSYAFWTLYSSTLHPQEVGLQDDELPQHGRFSTVMDLGVDDCSTYSRKYYNFKLKISLAVAYLWA